MTYRGNFPKHPIAPETGSPACTRTRLAQSSDLEFKANTCYSASLSFLGCPMRLTSSWVKVSFHKQLGQSEVPQAVGSKKGHLIYLVIISNSQPRNQFLHTEKKNKKF